MVTQPLAQPAGTSTVADPFASVDIDLQALDGLPAAEQVHVFDRIHRALTATLATSGTVRAGSPSDATDSGGG